MKQNAGQIPPFLGWNSRTPGVDFILKVYYTYCINPEASMDKQRAHERRKAMSFTPVYDSHSNVLLGYLGDLTLQGALLVGEKPVEANRKLTLAIEFRETSETPANRMLIPARVAWCRREDHLTFYNSGLEFTEMSEANKNVIEAILERFRFVREIPT
jgi:hypothetical protein